MVEHGTENAGVPSSILGLSTTWIDSELDDNVGLFCCVRALSRAAGVRMMWRGRGGPSLM